MSLLSHCARGLTTSQLTPFVTKRMAPTRSRYTQDIEKNGKIITVERAFDGKDYLKMWMSDNGQEVLERERLDQENGRAEETETVQQKAS